MERKVTSMLRKWAFPALLLLIGFGVALDGFGQTASSNWCDGSVDPNIYPSPTFCSGSNPNISPNTAGIIVPYIYSSSYRPSTSPGPYAQYESYAYSYWATCCRIDLLPFRMLKPLNYLSSSNANKKYPLVIMLHGRGERGTNNNQHLVHSGSQHLNAVNNGKYDGFVVYPQEPLGAWTNKADYASDQLSAYHIQMLAMIDALKLAYPIDPDRIIIHGLSSGGTGALAACYHRPDLFAAVMPLSANPGNTYPQMMERLSSMPVWWFQGNNDTNPSPSESGAAFAVLQNSGGIDPTKTKYTNYIGVGHNTWDYAYDEADCFSFISRANKRKIYVMSSNPICSGGEGMLGMSPGFSSYQWFKDNVLISGETNAKLKHITASGNYFCRVQRLGSSSYVYSDTVQMTVKPTITFNPSLILPSPSSATSVTLSVSEAFSQYQWTNGATTSSITTSITGDYSVRGYKNGCWTAYSPPVHVQSGTMGTPVPLAPSTLTATSNSPISVTLSWIDNATDELNYEIYRSTVSNSNYSLLDIINSNSTSFVDKTVSSNTDYYYLVRAVNQQAASTSNEAHVKTLQLDLPVPSAPSGLVLYSLNEGGLTLKWTASNTTYDIRRYHIYNNNILLGYSATPTYLFASIAPGNNYSFSVKAEDINGNISEGSETKFLAYDGQGLFVSKYTIPVLTSMPQYSTMTPVAEGYVTAPTITLAYDDNSTATTLVNKLSGGEFVSERKYFGLQYRGYIKIPIAGTYTFYVNSDDGSMVYLNNTLVVNNDGNHNDVTEKSGTYTFANAGWFPIKVDYYEQASGQSLTIKYSGPSLAKSSIPNSSLSTTPGDPIPTTTTSPDASTLSLAPTDASTSDQIKTWITVNLTGLTNVTYYELYRIKSSTNPDINASWNKIATINKAGNTGNDNFTYLDTKESPTNYLSPGTTYYYALKLLNQSSEKLYFFTSNYKPYTTPNTTISIPNTPSILVVAKTFNAVKTGTFVDNSNNETGFELWRSLEANDNFNLAFTLPKDATSFTDYTALANTNYYYKIRSYNQAGRSAFSNVDNTLPTITAYYSKPTGNLNELSTWGANPDGSGPPPVDFTSPNLTFYYSNRTDETILTTPWTVNGTNSKIIVETGKKLTVGTGVTLAGNLEVKANAEVKFESATIPNITSVEATSTLTFSNASTLPDLNYGNVVLETSGTKQLPATLRVRGSLTVAGATTIEGAPTNVELGGNLTYTDHLPVLTNVSVSFMGLTHEIKGANGAVQLSKVQSIANSEIKVTGVKQLQLGGDQQPVGLLPRLKLCFRPYLQRSTHPRQRSFEPIQYRKRHQKHLFFLKLQYKHHT